MRKIMPYFRRFVHEMEIFSAGTEYYYGGARIKKEKATYKSMYVVFPSKIDCDSEAIGKHYNVCRVRIIGIKWT